MFNRNKNRKAFTLIELALSILAIGFFLTVLIALFFKADVVNNTKVENCSINDVLGESCASKVVAGDMNNSN